MGTGLPSVSNIWSKYVVIFFLSALVSVLWISAIKHWQKEKKFQNLDCTKRKRKRKSTRTTQTKKNLLTNLLKSLALVQLLVSTLRTFPICLPVRLCPHCPCLFTNNSSHMLDLLQRLLLKHLSLPTSLAMIWNHPCGLHSSALSALFVCTLLPTKRTSSATSCCTGRWGGSFPASCAPNSSTGLMMSSGTFAVCISSTWTQRDASSLRPAWHCDTRFELRARWHLCRPVWCATNCVCMCVHFHLLQVIKLCVLAAEHVRVACEVVCFTDRPKFYHIALATECFEMAVVVSMFKASFGMWTFSCCIQLESSVAAKCVRFLYLATALLVLVEQV